jgi:hypothetical protein
VKLGVLREPPDVVEGSANEDFNVEPFIVHAERVAKGAFSQDHLRSFLLTIERSMAYL